MTMSAKSRMMTMSALTLFLCVGIAGIGVHIGAAQKDGHPIATGDAPPPLAKDGVPAVVEVSAGSFVMGADTVALPDSVTKGFGVMSTRPEHGDFDEVPAHPVRISKAFKMSVTEV